MNLLKYELAFGWMKFNNCYNNKTYSYIKRLRLVQKKKIIYLVL